MVSRESATKEDEAANDEADAGKALGIAEVLLAVAIRGALGKLGQIKLFDVHSRMFHFLNRRRLFAF